MKPLVVGGAIVVIAGCEAAIGLDDFILTDDADAGLDGAPPGITTSDGGFDAGMAVQLPPVTCSGNVGACAALGLDAGWTPVAVATGNAICPDGFSAAELVRSDPSAGAGTCDCVVGATAKPSCTGSLTFRSGSGCAFTLYSAGVAPGCLNLDSGTANGFLAYDAPDASDASCTASPSVDDGKVSAPVLTLCAPTTCADSVCGAAALGALKACVIAEGDVECPGGSFTVKRTVGSDVAVTCSDCTCTATNPSCTGQLLRFWSARDCTGTPFYSEPPATCVATTQTAIQSTEFTATGTATFTASGPKTVTSLSLQTPRTVCCAP